MGVWNVEITGLFIGILLSGWLVTSLGFAWRLHDWAGQVRALGLRWDREQRQASGAPTLQVRQQEQAHFEELVTLKPAALVWMHVILTLAVIAFALVLAWDADRFQEIGIRLIAPLGLACVAVSVMGWNWLHSGVARLAVISSTLYGPAPPRVKVRDVRVVEPTESQ